MANKIKNKFTHPKSTEFTPKDLIIDVKNGHLYYKSNYAVYRVVGQLFATNVEVTEDLTIGTADNTQVLFNNASTIDGLTNFTITPNTDGTGIVNIGTAVINNVDIDSGTIDGVKIGLGSPDFIFGTKFTATGDTVGTPRYTSRGTGQGTNLEITNSNKAFSSYNSGGAILLIKNSSATDPFVEIKGGLITRPMGNSPGTIKSSADVIAFASDKRLKENIINIENPLQKIKQLRGVYFDWKDKTKELGFIPPTMKNEIGMIAQEVEAVIPQAIDTAPFDNSYKGTDREKYKTIKYDRLIPLLVECVNEQQKQIDNLTNQIKQWQK